MTFQEALEANKNTAMISPDGCFLSVGYLERAKLGRSIATAWIFQDTWRPVFEAYVYIVRHPNGNTAVSWNKEEAEKTAIDFGLKAEAIRVREITEDDEGENDGE